MMLYSPPHLADEPRLEVVSVAGQLQLAPVHRGPLVTPTSPRKQARRAAAWRPERSTKVRENFHNVNNHLWAAFRIFYKQTTSSE